MNEHTLSITIPAGLADVRACLLDADALPRWNPAFTAIERSATSPESYVVTVRGIVKGTFRYDLVEPKRLEGSWSFPGFHESNQWVLAESGDGTTTVTHSFQNSGPVATLLGSAFATVAEQRLTRLSREVSSRRALRTATQS
jgi:uncharacterized protein YndB with AHSA1/START domain